MKTLFKKPYRTIGGASLALMSVAFISLLVVPLFLHAQNQPTPSWNGAPYDPETGEYREQPLGSDADRPADSPSPIYTPTGESLNPYTGPTGITDFGGEKPKPPANQPSKAEELAKQLTCFTGLSGGIFNFKGCVAQAVDMVMWLAARTLWMAGVLLNITLDYTLNLGKLLDRLPIVDIGWKVLRDVSNVVFIFITLWCGISITLGIGDNGKKAWGYIAQMVLVALFINFSLFITKAVVDASNVAALHFYSLIVAPEHQKDWDSGLSESFLYGLKISTLYKVKNLGARTSSFDSEKASIVGGEAKNAEGGLSFTNIILIGFFGSFFIIVTAWVFFAAAIMLMYRAITLIFLMVLSPLAFVGLILPGASGMAHSWWSKLWSQAFFAPLYLALAYVVVRTINAPSFQGALAGAATDQSTGFAAAITGSAYGNVAVIFNFIILIGLMVGALVVAQSLGAKGSDMAMAGWEKIKHVAVGETAGLVGRTAVRGLHFSEDGLVAKAGRKIGESRMGKTLLGEKWSHRVAHIGGFEFGLRKLDEKWSKSRLGQGALGKLVREQTTGKLAEAKFGGTKSATEAYEEHEDMVSRRREIEFGTKAKENAEKLAPFRQKERELLDAKVKKESEIEKKKKEIETAKKKGLSTAGLEKQKDEAEGKSYIDAKKELSAAEKLADTDPTKAAKVKAAKAKVLEEKRKGSVAAIQEDITTFRQTNAKEMDKHSGEIKFALSQMSTEGFLNQQKSFFLRPEVMDLAVLGQDKYQALMKSEHFTRAEKEEYTQARWQRTKETAKRRKERNEWYLKDQLEYQSKLDDWQSKTKKVSDRFKPMFKTIDEEIKRTTGAIAAAKEKLAEADTPTEKKAARTALKTLEGQLKGAEGRRASIEKRIDPDKRKYEQELGLRNEKGIAVQPERPPQIGWDEAPDIRKALRNILRPDEVVNLYRYDREAFGLPQIVDTIKQGTWNLVRNTGEIDSNSMEQVRVDKRHYIQQAGDYDLGLDPLIIQKLEARDRYAAQTLREKLHKQKLEVGDTAYFENFNKKWKDDLGREWDNLEEILKETLKKANLEDAVSVDERKFRAKAGNTMYEDVQLNLANDEFQMMPGIIRNMLITRRHLNRATTPDYDKRDLEDTLPHVETWIEEFKHALLGEGEITQPNLEVLNWLVNEDRGQRFTQFNSIRSDLKPVWEIIKGLVANTARAQRSIHSNKKAVLDAVEDLKRAHGKSGTPFKNFFAEAGTYGEMFKEKEQKA